MPLELAPASIILFSGWLPGWSRLAEETIYRVRHGAGFTRCTWFVQRGGWDVTWVPYLWENTHFWSLFLDFSRIKERMITHCSSEFEVGWLRCHMGSHDWIMLNMKVWKLYTHFWSLFLVLDFLFQNLDTQIFFFWNWSRERRLYKFTQLNSVIWTVWNSYTHLLPIIWSWTLV